MENLQFIKTNKKSTTASHGNCLNAFVLITVIFLLSSFNINAQTVTKQLYLTAPGQSLDRRDPVNTGDTSTDSSETIGETIIPGPSNGVAYWHENSIQNPQYRVFNGTSFGSEFSAPTVNSNKAGIIISAQSPNDYQEAFMVEITDASDIYVQRWDGSNWTSESFNPLTNNVQDKNYFGAQIAYSPNGNAMLVWDNNAADNIIHYRTWNGTTNTWSIEQTFTITIGANNKEIVNMKLAADPNSNEMVLGFIDTDFDDYVMVWNGTSWTNQIELNTINSINTRDIDVAYESLSGDAMVVYLKNDDPGIIYYRIWNGTSWSAESSTTSPVGPDGQIDFVKLASDPNSDRIAIAVTTDFMDAWYAIWNGSAWGNKVVGIYDANDHLNSSLIDIAFETSSGDILAVTWSFSSANVQYLTFSGGSWSSLINGPAFTSVPRELELYSDPLSTSNQIMLMVNDASQSVQSRLWSGSAWGAWNQHEVISGNDGSGNVGDPMTFFWYKTETVNRDSSVVFKQDPGMCSNLNIVSGDSIRIRTYINLLGGTLTNGQIYDFSAILKYGNTTIATLNNALYNSSNGGSLYWATASPNITIPAGDSISLTIRMNAFPAGVNFKIVYDSDTRPSKISFPVSTFIDQTSVGVYSAPYPGGSLITNVANSSTVYIRAAVSDPFGSYDITSDTIRITNPFGSNSNYAATTVNSSGCTKTYEYVWNTPVTPGRYTLRAKANEGYEGTVTDTLSSFFYLCAPAISTTHTNISCNGGSNGTIDLTVSSGAAPFTYDWSDDGPEFPDNDNQDLSGLSPGIYTVTVTDAGGCSSTTTVSITQPTAINKNTFTTNVSCNGGNNGRIDLSVSGGTLPYTYFWNTGATTQDLINRTAGGYSVTITDANGCTATTSATISQPSSLLIAYDTVSVTCFSNGSINLIPSGGTTPYTFDWADIPGTINSEDRSGLTGGTYSVTVTDANACTRVQTIILGVPNCSAYTSICQSETASVFSVDPDPMVDSYQWTVPPSAVITSGNGTPQITVNFNGTSPGLYQVCVKTINMCGESNNTCMLINVRTVNASANASPQCLNESIQFTANGGVAYSWSGPGGFFSSIANPVIYNASLAHNGIYTVTVTDNTGCTGSATVTVNIQNNPTLSTGITNAGCGTATGSIDLIPSGGTPGYTYIWTNGATTQDISSIYSGIYNVVVTDANGCKATSYNAVSDVGVDLTVVISDSIDCYNGGNGDINLTMFAGLPPFTYQWSNGASTEDLVNVPADVYYVAVTDNFGCKGYGIVNLTQPPQLNLDVQKTNVNCFGQNTGSINLSVSGGTPGYTYIWSNGQTSQDLSGLTAGNYTVTVTDNKSCSNTLAITIAQPASALSASLDVTQVNCNGAGDGSIIVNASGGTSPYTYDWSDLGGSSNIKDRTNLAPGSYTVTITDENGCSVVRFANITQPVVINLSTTKTDVSCFGGSNGSIDLSLSGGTFPYTYTWSHGATTQDVSGLPSGTYDVTVTDNNNCTATIIEGILQPTILDANAVQTPALCNGATNGSIDLTVSGGSPGYTYVWSNGSTLQDIGALDADTYSVTVTDSKSCSVITSVTVSQPAQLDVNATLTHILCNSASTGAIDLNVIGGTGPYTYDWADIGGPNNTEDRTNLSTGNYSVIVTDNNGCSEVQNYTITQPVSLSLSMINANLTCNGSNNGSIELTVSGGVLPYSYLWNGGATTKDRNNLAAGVYSVTVTDANNCTGTMTSLPITQPAVLNVTTIPNHVSCYGAGTGSIISFANGGTMPYNYSWSDGNTTQNISGLYAGDYAVTVTDANNCSVNRIQSITQPDDALELFAMTTSASCSGPNGSIDLTVIGGQPGYSYVWSNGYTGQDPSSLVAGTYTVTVTDALTCQNFETFQVDAAAPLIATVTTFDRSCTDVNGTAYATYSGGSPPYSFAWSNGSNTQVVENLNSGNYTVTVTEKNGCVAIASGTVGIPTCLPPDGRNDYYKTPFNTPITNGTVAPVNPLAQGYDSDPDHALSLLTFNPMQFPTPAQGVIDWDPNTNGLFTYTPAPGYVGTFSILYEVCDPTELCDTARLFITVGNPQIGLAKTVSSGPVDNGNGTYNMTYSLKLKNTGDVSITNLQVQDNLGIAFAGSTSFVVNSINSSKFNTNATYNGVAITNLLTGTDVLAAGDSGIIQIMLTVRPGNKFGTYYNTSTASGTDPNGDVVQDVSQDGTDVDPDNDGNPGNNSVTTPVDFPQLQLTKTATLITNVVPPNGVVNVGDRINYAFQVCNTGKTTLTNITISDPLITMSGGPIASLAVGACNSTTFTGTYTIQQKDIDAGKFINSATATGFDPKGNPVSDVSDDPNDFTNEDPDGDGDPDDSTVTVILQIPNIVLDKKLISTVDNLDGTFTAKFELEIQNNGNVTLGDIQLLDNLDREYGNYQSHTPTEPGDYTVINLNIPQNSTNPVYLNYDFDGSSDQKVLDVASGGTTKVTEKVKVTYELLYVPGKYEFYNQGFVFGDIPANDDPLFADDNDPEDVIDSSDVEYLIPFGQIEGRVWNDLNANGVQDIGEPAMPGIETRLYNCDSTLVLMDTTDASGNYLFEFIQAPSNYFVYFDKDPFTPQYGFTFQNAGANDAIDSDVSAFGFGPCIFLDSSGVVTSYDAGLVLLASTGDYVWMDIDGDGMQEPGEKGCPDVKVSIIKSSTHQAVKNVYTDSLGYYFFTDLIPDNYYLKFESPSGIPHTKANAVADYMDSDVDDSNGANTTASMYLSPGENDMSCDAGYFNCARISGFAWLDDDMDGIRDWVEKGINGLKVYIIDANTGLTVDVVITGTKPGTPSDDGYYKSNCLKPGNYYVKFERPGNFGAGPPYKGGDPNFDSDITHENGINTTRIISVASGDNITGIDGGFQKKSLVGDKVWIDANHNGLQDAGEKPVAGIKVSAYNSKGYKVSESQSGNDGQFLLDGLTQGSFYFKFEVSDPRYRFTTPHAGLDDIDSDVDGTNGYGSTKTITIAPGETRPTIDAGIVASVLAIEWLNFEGRFNGSFTELDWLTGIEEDNEYFVIERKFETDENFEEIDRVNAHPDPYQAKHEYEYDDFDVAKSGVYYYRIKQVDKNGSFTYSKIIAVHVKQESDDLNVLIYPNPVRDALKIELSVSEDTEIEMHIHDSHGRAVKMIMDNQFRSKGKYNEIFKIDQLSSGQYTLQIKSSNKVLHKKFSILN